MVKGSRKEGSREALKIGSRENWRKDIDFYWIFVYYLEYEYKEKPNA
jgi:hypothetical protein